jgi:hypothetical protein
MEQLSGCKRMGKSSQFSSVPIDQDRPLGMSRLRIRCQPYRLMVKKIKE